jgi:hypothetical protein
MWVIFTKQKTRDQNDNLLSWNKILFNKKEDTFSQIKEEGKILETRQVQNKKCKKRIIHISRKKEKTWADQPHLFTRSKRPTPRARSDI